MTKTTTVDLYEAFEAICRDEELFRAELKQYSELVDGKPQVTPAGVPPLVAQHLPWIKPSARNKMFNAELVEIRSPGRAIEPSVYPETSDALRRNTERWQPLLHTFAAETVAFAPADGGRGFSGLVSRVGHRELVAVLRKLEWAREGHFEPHLCYLEQLDGRLATVDNWLLIAPQLTGADGAIAPIMGSVPMSLVRRTRQSGKPSFSRVAGVEHSAMASQLISSAAQPLIDDQPAAAGVTVGPHTGVALIYPVVEAKKDSEILAAITRGQADPSKVVMAFTLFAPKSANGPGRRLVRFRTKSTYDTTSAIVNTGEA
jgi:hypothetical protein